MISFNFCKKLGRYAGAPILQAEGVITRGELVWVRGPSGSGKTTLLSVIAGFIKPDRAFIVSNHTIWVDTEKHIDVPVHVRRVGFVFQHYGLFPHFTVDQHLSYASKDILFNEELLQASELSSKRRLKPGALSGGEQQRLSIIRALAARPSLLLMDEPFSALDERVKDKLIDYLSELIYRSCTTCLVSSHRSLISESKGRLTTSQEIHL